MQEKVILFCLFFILTLQTFSQQNFYLFEKGTPATIIFDINDAEIVKISANLLADDIERLTGVRPIVQTNFDGIEGALIIIGSANECSIITQLVADDKLNLTRLIGKWESYAWCFLPSSLNLSESTMVIVGSDYRGTAYGALDLSRKLGVSPWYWWADAAFEQVNELSIPRIDFISNEPSVKYRGIFLNDECWGLNPWASKTFETSVENIGPKTYAKIFELLLRLKANLIWPAMHPCSNAFYSNLENPKLADDYGIVVGSSHAEPMLRNNVSEWRSDKYGSFNYFTNRNNVLKYWDERVSQSSHYESIYTLGMRGIHDSRMIGANSTNEQLEALTQVINDQRAMLKMHVNDDESAVPQVFTAYKEVLDIYDAGLELPEDVTLVWPDDNYGYIKRLSNAEEQKRVGGSGIYYHLSYWGRPHDYLWLSSSHPSLIREEMIKATLFQSNEVWVANVGDIKPLEYNLSLFLDIAYDSKIFHMPLSEQEHHIKWYKEIFGDVIGLKAADLMWKYYQIIFERRPEFMGWSQTEPTRKTHFTEYNHFQVGDEAQKRIDEFNLLANEARKLELLVPQQLRDALYQLVVYPVVCAGHLNKKVLYLEKAYKYAFQGRTSANDFAQMAQIAYDSIVLETNYYNHTISAGKWKNMMFESPRSLPVFDPPIIPQWTFYEEGWGVAVEGDEEIRRTSEIKGPLELPRFNRMTNRTFFVDLFLKEDREVNWSIRVSHRWIKVSENKGQLTNKLGHRQKRIWVSIDWDLIEKDGISRGEIVFQSDDKQVKLSVFADNFFITDTGKAPLFIEENGYTSIYAGNYSRKINGIYPLEILKGLGYSGNSVWTYPIAHKDKSIDLPSILEYDFYAPRQGHIVVHVYCLPTHPLNREHGLRVGVSVDDEKIQMKSFETYGRSEEWKLNVLSNNTKISTKHNLLSKGKHVLKLIIPDPAVIVDRIEIDYGGLPDAYSALPESKYVK